MHDDRSLVEARLTRFVTDHLAPALYRDARPVEIEAWQVPGEPVPFAEAIEQSFEPVPVGWRWGTAWSTVWLHVRGEVPAEWADVPHTRPELVVDFGYNRSRSGFQAEGLAYRPDGSLIKAIAPMNSWLPVVAGERVDVLIEAAANPDVAGDYTFEPTTLGDLATVGAELIYELKQLEVALLDTEVWELLQDVWTLRGLMAELPLERPRRHEVLRALERMLDVLDPDDIPGTAGAGRAELADVLARPAAASAHRMVATGHAHIDSAWLWPLRETVRKCARTFTNVMTLMDENPDFVFACSSAQQYLWMKEHYPAVFERIREKVAAGQFVPVGGMWVESDTNMPGSEAMARQFVAGKRFFLEEFGVECEEAWLPDSFGYSAALPQIVSAAGEKWFLTQKISWNQVNRMPHHTFWWEGIDGTRVFTHFPPADTYGSDLSAMEVHRAERQYAEKGKATVSLIPFGWGDGGGGPTREMIAAARRLASLEGSPAVRMDTPQAFFAQAQAEYPDAPVWSGEMYLELHRGVYTSQLRTKQGNRRSEALLHEAEAWATAAAVRAGFDYPYDELETAWHTVLLLQFHDILPGSSIAWVHREAERRHGEVAALCERIVADALAALDVTPDAKGSLIASASPRVRDGIPAYAVAPAATAVAPVTVTEQANGWMLDSGSLAVTVAPDGTIAGLRGASGREAIPAGERAAVLRLHRDLPNLWDAWDLDAHYKRTVRELDAPESVTLDRRADGSVAVVSRLSTGPSSIERRVILRPGATAAEVELVVDWRDREKILKLAFPFDVRADRTAAETQFGHVFRATHTNTSWDAARFEACQHRWLHVGDAGFGVAVANDSTYGYDVDRETRADGGTTTTARFSILRAPLFPDPETDQGEHVVRFSVQPDAEIADAVALGYARNLPARAVTGSPVAALVTSSAPGVVIETVKLAEDRLGDVVVRLYESLGARETATITLDAMFDSIARTDLLERELGQGDAESTEGGITLTLRPFELVTLRFRGVRVGETR
jgi:alpha-mannosidase